MHGAPLVAVCVFVASIVTARADGRPLRVVVDVATDRGAATASATFVDPVARRRATLSPAAGEARVRLEPAGGGVALEASVVYDAPALVDHEVVRVTLAGPARVVHHDLRLAPLAGSLRVDRPTPVVVVTPDLALVGGAGIVAARYTARDGAIDVDLILDDRASHPFSVYTQCLTRLPDPPDWHALERRRPLDRLARRAGDEVVAHATLYPLARAQPALPLVVERWPAGAGAAIVFTDHADRTDAAALRAVLYGSAEATRAGGRGVLGHGLRLTKTFFARGGRGTLADDPETRALAQVLAASGSEVGSHSITEHADGRATVREALAAFDPWQATTWIDHEPYTNCEAISSEGWRTGDPYGIHDLLVEHGYRWVWAATDVKEQGLDLFASGPAAFPLPPDPRLWVFRSTWFAEPPAALVRLLDERALDALERDGGLAVLHTYLSASPARTVSAEHRRALVVRPDARGVPTLDPLVDGLLARLAARAARGALVVAPWREVGERLRALEDVLVRYEPDGSAVVENAGNRDVGALTVAVAATDVALAVDAAAVLGRRSDGERTALWFDLPAHARVRVRAAGAGGAVPFLPLADVVGMPR